MRDNVWKMAWELLSPRERMVSGVMLLISIIGAGAQVAMIGAVMPFLSVLSDPSLIGSNKYLSYAFEAGGFKDAYNFSVWLGVATITIIFAANIVLVMRQYAIHRYTFRRVHGISIRLARSYLGRDYGYFLNRNSADISKRILAEANSISNSFLRPAVDLVASSLSVMAILGFLLLINPTVTMVGAGTVVVVYGGLYWLVSGRLRSLGEEQVKANKDRFTTIGEAFGGIKDIKILGKEDVFFRKFESASRKVTNTNISRNMLSDMPRYGIQAIFFGGVVLLCLLMIDPSVFNANDASLGAIVPTLGAFALAGQRLLPEAQKVYASLAKIVSGTASVKSVHEDMTREEAMFTTPVQTFEKGADICLRGVSFRYPGATTDSLSNIDLTITKGRKVGIVGGTGSGKTTLADICLGLLTPTEGNFVAGGKAIKDKIDRLSWRSRVGYVPQDIFLVDGTFLENIAFGESPSAIDEARVIECAKMARLHDVVMSNSEDGYYAQVGERGIRLSGGQRQRIGIARALYRGADFLVMDEATSALDNETEKEVMSAIGNLPEHMTVVMIAHRLSTLRGCDEIVVLEHGEIIEHGAWNALMDKGGRFFKLVNSAVA